MYLKNKSNYIRITVTICLFFLLFFSFSCNLEKEKSKKEHKHTNALINETSPYLLQHAHNPVNWKPWNENTLKEAQEKQKLIIISIGYSACHWCHVMEDESFKNDTIAKLMNENFISIKVDKEERPDINQVYSKAVELMIGKSGWPLNCIALPDGKPVFGGTYFTPEEWSKVLNDISSVYQNNPKKVINYANKLTEGIKKVDLIELNTKKKEFTNSTLNTHINNWKSYLDFENGGQKTDLKFPLPNNLSFLLKNAVLNNNDSLLNYVNTTLTKMAYGGIYDQIGGGFSRYSVDKKWHIPHFEKMLYDNAQLVSIYSNMYLEAKNPLYKSVVYETLDFVKRELTATNGAFYSSLDADSFNGKGELEEGVFYAWNEKELKSIITKNYNLFKAYYNINEVGKWGQNNYIFIKTTTNTAFAKKYNLSISELTKKVNQWKKLLFEAREKRNKPRVDNKILTSWNALMIKAYADAYRVFGETKFLETAKKNASFLIQNQLKKDGGLYHNYKNGKSTINGYLEDYATIIDAFITLYQVTFDEFWLTKANNLVTYTSLHFKDKTTELFYFTSNLDADLITRKIDIIDNVIPSSNSMMATNLFQLGHYYDNKTYTNQAKQMLHNVLPSLNEAPSAYSNWLSLYTNYSSPFYEVVIAGKKATEKLQEFQKNYIPNILIAGSNQESTMPLLENRYSDNETFIYVCEGNTCKFPVTAINKAISLLNN